MEQRNNTGRLPASLIARLVGSQFSDLEIRSLSHLATGWSHDVWRCGGTLLRFPLHHNESGIPHNEALLRHLRQHLGVQLPECTHEGSATDEYRFNFAGYRWIQGDSLLQAKISKRDFAALLGPLATLLRTLHQTSPSIPKRFSVATTDRGDELQLRTQSAQKRASELKVTRYAELAFEAAKAMNPAPEPCQASDYRLVHGDLHAGQLLIDSGPRIVALIDWDDVRLGDPAYDLQLVYSFGEPASRGQFWDIYGSCSRKRQARHLALSYGLAFLARACQEGDSELAASAALQLRNALVP